MLGEPNLKPGHYLGTEIDEKWWSRYRKDGLFARGNGDYWIANNCFYFKRYLTKTDIVIPLNEVREIKTGEWHAGRWAGGATVLKLIWIKRSMRISSGFVVSKNTAETNRLVETITRLSDSINSSVKT